MTDTMKLLRAFIKASGYEIEILIPKPSDFKWDFNGDKTKPVSLVADYKVTKKYPAALVPIPIQSDEWSCIVKFVESHANDIEQDINDFGELKPIWDFMNRNC